MEVSMVELLLLFALSITSWSYVEAEKKVTLTGVETSGNDDNVIDSWTSSISDNRIFTSLVVKKNCPGPIQMNVQIFQDGHVVSATSKSVKQLPTEIEDICQNIDAPDPDDDSCSAAEGKHVYEACDISSCFSEMDSGKYEVNIVFEVDNNDIGTATIGVKVEDE